MSIADLEEHQRAAWASYMSALVDRCTTRYTDAARLVGFELKIYPKLYNLHKMRINIAPLYPIWPIVCQRYIHEVFEGQKELFLENTGVGELFSRFIHWELWPGLVADNENLRNILRVLELLPCNAPQKAIQALELAVAEYPMSDHLYKMRMGQI